MAPASFAAPIANTMEMDRMFVIFDFGPISYEHSMLPEQSEAKNIFPALRFVS